MKSVLVRLQEYSGQASGAEKGVIHFLLKNPEKGVNYNIHQLADITYTLSSTIILVAKDAYLKLLRMNKPCLISEDWHAQLLQARNIKKEDVAIIISYSGLTEEMLKCASTVKQKGAPIIAITRFEDSPLSRMADYNLSVAATEFIFRSGAMSSRIAQLNMIDILYTGFLNKQFESSLTQFQNTHIDKPNKSTTQDEHIKQAD